MYRIEFYDKNLTALTTIFEVDFFELQYTTEINGPGSAQFSILVRNSKATPVNFKLFNRIIIRNEIGGKFIGYIDNLRATSDSITIRCIGMLGLFKRRLTSASINTVNAGVALQNLLTATNSNDDTGVTIGTNSLTQIINGVTFQRSSVFNAWQKIIGIAEAEMEINIDNELNTSKKFGSDVSSFVRLEYNINQLATANIFDFDVEVIGKDMANDVIGIGQVATSNKTDPTSIGLFGLLETAENFSETDNNTDLDNETQSFVNEHKLEFYVPKLLPNPDKIDFNLLGLGDIISVQLDNGFIEVNQNERIIQRTIVLLENGIESLSIQAVVDGTNTLPNNFLDEFSTLSKRVGLLEGDL